jgi:hypothetical protein
VDLRRRDHIKVVQPNGQLEVTPVLRYGLGVITIIVGEI